MVIRTMPTKEAILEILAEVKDPELPVIDIVELGIVRDVAFEGDRLRIDVTPTYSGCPGDGSDRTGDCRDTQFARLHGCHCAERLLSGVDERLDFDGR